MRGEIPGGLVHHSDRGVQYACGDYIGRLQPAGVLPSMSRAGVPYDNAMAESFMKTLKTEEVDASAYQCGTDSKRDPVIQPHTELICRANLRQ